MGLTVGVFGGESMTVRGVIPLPGTGGVVLVEDTQQRIHRIQARAVVKVSQDSGLPDPFPGWRSQGLIPLSTALRLKHESRITWKPATVILGTGNRALRFGSSLLESGVPEVHCVETLAQWGAKRTAGWEVERRRFEMAGGKISEARPVRLSQKSPLLWEIRLEDTQGVRILETARVVAAGPFADSPGVREYPPGSYLFELEQTAGATRYEDVEGWALEEERGRALAIKIIKALAREVGPVREELDRVQRRSKIRLRRAVRHMEEPFTPAYQGKWIAPGQARLIREFTGVPRELQKSKPIASVECFEEINCNLCEKACPTAAIDFSKKRAQVLVESACIACGACLPACPSAATLMVHERENLSNSQLTLSWRGQKPWELGEFATLLNRRGESLGSGRVTAILPNEAPGIQLVQLDVPTHLLWEARGLKRPKPTQASGESFVAALAQAEHDDEKVPVTLNGERRLVRDKISVSLALFETGRARPEDVLLCRDGSCGLCTVSVDGIRKLGCQTQIHRGMAIKLEDTEQPQAAPLCPCQGVTREQVIERMTQGRLQSPEAVLSVTHVGEGRCHGQLCQDPLRRILIEEGLDASQWIDWRFPSVEWVLVPGAASRD
jgi:Fe-S-cluster-containing hydrogenase component 2